MKRILLIIGAAAVFAACTTESTEESTLASEYLPLRMGNTWYYSYPKYGSDTIVSVFTIDSTMEYEGKEYYCMGITYTAYPGTIKEYRCYRTEGDFLWELLKIGSRYQVVKRADFTLQMDQTYAMPIFYEDDTAQYVVSVLEKTDTRVRYFYDQPGWIDDELFFGFEKGKGIVNYSREYLYGLILVRADLKP